MNSTLRFLLFQVFWTPAMIANSECLLDWKIVQEIQDMAKKPVVCVSVNTTNTNDDQTLLQQVDLNVRTLRVRHCQL